MKRLLSFVLFLWLVCASQWVHAQQKLDLRLFLDARITNAQSITLTELNISSEGRGDVIMTLFFENLLDERLEDLFLYVFVESQDLGLLAEFDQVPHKPFSMGPRQIAQGTNNQFETGIPGLGEIDLEGDITDEAISIVGQGELPTGLYRAVVAVYQGGNRTSGGELIAMDEVEILLEASSDERDIILLTPGAPLGEDFSVPTNRPFFSWTGGGANKFRVIVVEAIENETAESLLDQAFLTQPQQTLDFRMLDREFTGSNTQFTYPASGVEALQPGRTYFWQVFALIQTPGGLQPRPSEIWQFRVSQPGQASTTSDEEEPLVELLPILTQLIDDEELSRLLTGGFRLSSITMDNMTQREQQVIMNTLMELLARIEAGDIEILD